MKSISLTQGYVTQIDDEDYELVSKYKWHLYLGKHLRKNNKIGVVRHYARTYRNNKNIYMHRLLCPTFKMCDHIDGDGLNNQRSNLRECTNIENSMNRRKWKNSTTYKGLALFRHKAWKKWHIQIGYNCKQLYLGSTFFEIVAARVYNYWAKKLHGEFARLNDV